MSPKKVPRANVSEILGFLKSRGVVLSDEAIHMLKERLKNEPVSKPTLERSKTLVRNPLVKQILDRTFVRRSAKIQKIIDTNPILQLIDEKRRQILSSKKSRVLGMEQMPDDLRIIFYNENRWQPYLPFVYILPEGQVVKVIESAYPDKPYIGYLCTENGKTMIYTTRRHIPLDSLPKAKFYRLKEGTFRYEIDEIKQLEKQYIDFIMLFHQ